MANLVVAADGTWNTPEDTDNGRLAPTNVVKIHNALARVDGEGVAQRAYYHPGVGTDGSPLERLLGGGLGRGLDRNIMSAYRWLAGRYRPGDRIWLFGFSRGAYTVRSLAGMVSRCGLLAAETGDELSDREIWAAIEEIFAAYRHRTTLTPKTAERMHNARPGLDQSGTTPVHFIGVWDTVGALGMPDDLALLKLIDDPRDHQFHDTRLSTNVAHARHAVALDEMRRSFRPTLWTGVEMRDTVRQIWFAGVHSDVGGGYAETGLSDITLKWMIGEAEALGLAFRKSVVERLKPDPQGMQHNSVTGVFEVLTTAPRAAPPVDGSDKEAEGTASNLHPSAIERHLDPPIQIPAYWPTRRLEVGGSETVDVFARERWNATGIYLEEGATYRFSGSGEWLDGTLKAGPQGTSGARFQPAEVAHLAANLVGKAEKLYQRMTGEASADFWWTRREEELPWLSLVGYIAGEPQQTFLIGRDVEVKVTASGYLHAFCNDAWHAYKNNRGSIRLKVTRVM